MKNLIAFLVLSAAVFAVVGGLVGLFTTEQRMFDDDQRGSVLAHRCIVERGYYCGMYDDPSYGAVEISRGAQFRQ